jgi:hypothetical protein
MSDNLVKRLRDPALGIETTERNLMNSAADLIEALDKTCKEWAEVSQRNYQRAKEAEAKLRDMALELIAVNEGADAAEAKLAKALEALEVFSDDRNWFDVRDAGADPYDGREYAAWRGLADEPKEFARTALASLQGDKT